MGDPLLIGENLNESVGAEKIREYVWFMETKMPYAPTEGDNPYFLGRHNDTSYYFYYEPERITVLDYAFLSTVRYYMVFADGAEPLPGAVGMKQFVEIVKEL